MVTGTAISADSCTYLVGWVMITLWPFLLLIIPTLFVSNECDTLLNRLNDLRQVDAPKRRGHSPTASPASAQEMTGLRSLSSSPTGSTGSAGGVSAVLQTYGTNSAEQSGYHEFRPMHLRAFLIDRHNYGSVGQGLGFVMFQYVVTLPLLVGYQGVFWAVAYVLFEWVFFRATGLWHYPFMDYTKPFAPVIYAVLGGVFAWYWQLGCKFTSRLHAAHTAAVASRRVSSE